MALKEFEAGESIRAVETNANNHYLESLISEAAGDLRTYLENAIAQLEGNFVLTGSILAIPYSTVPIGYLKCDGSSLLREDYADLFEKIGTTYGAADDYHFNIPDYQGVFLRGYGGSAASLGTRQAQGLPNISGGISNAAFGTRDAGCSISGCFNGSGIGNTPTQGGWDNNYGKFGSYLNFNASNSNNIYGAANEVRPANMSVIWIIKY
jgi:hypothetical protein